MIKKFQNKIKGGILTAKKKETKKEKKKATKKAPKKKGKKK